MKRLITISVLIIFLFCSKERKHYFPHYGNDESALNELFIKYPSIPPYYEINLDSINRLKVFNQIYIRELTIEDYLDSIKYTIYSGGISESSTTYKLIVINYENLNTAIPFVSSNGYSVKILSREFTNLLKAIHGNNGNTKIGKAISIIDKLIRNSYNFVRFEMNDTIQIHKLALINQWEKNGRKKETPMERPEYYSKFINHLNCLGDLVKNLNYGFNNESEKRYLIYRDQDWEIIIIEIDDNYINVEYFNPANVQHLIM